jgi:hypothetical protein
VLPSPGGNYFVIAGIGIGARKNREHVGLDVRSGSFTSILPCAPHDRLDPNLGHGSRGGDLRGGHRTGSHAETSAEALARHHRKDGGGNRLRFRRLDFVLKSFVFVAVGVFIDRSFFPSIVPNGHDQNFYLVINNYGNFGPAFAETDVSEADLETVISDLTSGQYSDPVRVVAFNTAEQWAEDASEDVAREIIRRLDLAGDALPSSIAAFVDRNLGPDRQLTLRLA